MLRISQVSFSYNNTPLLNDITLNLRQGEIATLIGTSGSGKSTIFKLITGVLPLQSGSITVNNIMSPKAYTQVAYMMQEDLLLPWRTVIRNMTLASELGTSNRTTNKLIEEAHQILNDVGLSECSQLYPHELSGGMRQRVSLARALLQHRPLLLLDEPFAALDVSLREQMYLLLRSVNRYHNTTILLVTHDFRDALSLSDRIFLLSNKSIAYEWTIDAQQRQNPTYIGSLLENLKKTIMQ